MFGFASMFESPERRKARIERHRQHIEERLKAAEPWTEKTAWKRELNIQANTYHSMKLFDVGTTKPRQVWSCSSDKYQDSPSGRFRYVHLRVERGDELPIYRGSSKGTVVFDGPIVVPALFEKNKTTYDGVPNPWMSLTPMEVLTLRPGTRKARGTVIIAGLGLGHQLIEVSKRRSVKKILLIEQHQELVDWLYPKIEPHLGMKNVEVIVGDAYVEMPKLTADVALVDVFECYGNNNTLSDGKVDRLRIECMGINTLWCWGAAPIGSDYGWW